MYPLLIQGGVVSWSPLIFFPDPHTFPQPTYPHNHWARFMGKKPFSHQHGQVNPPWWVHMACYDLGGGGGRDCTINPPTFFVCQAACSIKGPVCIFVGNPHFFFCLFLHWIDPVWIWHPYHALIKYRDLVYIFSCSDLLVSINVGGVDWSLFCTNKV